MVETIEQIYGLDAPKVFSAMLKVPREEFVLDDFRDFAYNDSALPIGYDQTISQPYTVAFMTHLLDVQKTDIVLEIGTGSGYQSAILSKLAKKVYSVERIDELALLAKKTFKRLKIRNVVVKQGDGIDGWPQHAPYDKEIVTAGLFGSVPDDLIRQLKYDGILVAPMRGKMTRFTKGRDKLRKKTFGRFSFVPFVES